MVKLIFGDILKEYPQIPEDSVDLILTDPPYGILKKGKSFMNGVDWDNSLSPDFIFSFAEKVLKVGGRMVLFSQEPLTSKLITKASSAMSFNYKMIWQKNHFANALGVNKNPVSYFEDILVFSKVYDSNFKNPIRDYSNKILDFKKLTCDIFNKKIGHRKADHFFRGRSLQFHLCSKKD